MSDHTRKELRTDVHTVEELRAGFQAANATCCDRCRASAADRFDRAIAKVRAEAKAEALREAVRALNEVVEDAAAHGITNGLAWQTGALAMRDQLKIRADKLVTE